MFIWESEKRKGKEPTKDTLRSQVLSLAVCRLLESSSWRDFGSPSKIHISESSRPKLKECEYLPTNFHQSLIPGR